MLGHRHWNGQSTHLFDFVCWVGWDQGCSFGHAHWSGEGACQAAVGALPSGKPHTCTVMLTSPGPGASPRGEIFPPTHPRAPRHALVLHLTQTHQQAWAGEENKAMVVTRMAWGGCAPPTALSAQHLPKARLGAKKWLLLPQLCGQVSGEGGQLCSPSSPSRWVTVGTGCFSHQATWPY